ncbi:MAG: MotA/TolQ/ExbB proton channel family protein [Kiritimatiellae bacterium]|nr:MotA/TolQ/ExbB proton channel family protein [Kiritimatiellia bacterium]
MKKMMRLMAAAFLLAGTTVAPVAAFAAEDLVASDGTAVSSDTSTNQSSGGGGFWQVVFGTPGNRDYFGMFLWFMLFGDGAAAIYFIVDCKVITSEKKLIPATLVQSVQAAMAEGDIMKALEACEKEPSPMARVLASAFQHVEEGFDVIQQAVDAAADLETERLMQRLTWISVCSNLAPSLGLLGTVEGMILCFATLASGTPDIGALAGNISQALYTTAGGLVVSIPALTFFYALRKNATRLILRMSALTMELIKDLRNVEVDAEAEG